MLTKILSWFVVVKPNETAALLTAFTTFFCILSSYFVQLPLRDELGIALGTSWLPSLFVGSLIVTSIAAPLTSRFLSQGNQDPSQGIKKFYTFIAAVLFTFWLMFLVFIKGDTAAEEGQKQWMLVVLYCAFYLWVGVQNVLCISTLWARCADVFPNEVARRLFGFIAAGSTLGQLNGSFIAKTQIQFLSKGVNNVPPYHLILTACLLMIFASIFISSLRSINTEEKVLSPQNTPISSGKMLDGFVLILRSNYLILAGVYFILNYSMASQFYFEKSIIVSKHLQDSSQRTSWFAGLNLYSGLITFILQITLTGKLLSWLDFRVALSITPCLCSLGMLAVTMTPTPFIIGLADVLRKLVTFAIARPARETLFTVLTREEKYKAKLILDAIVQRIGDSLGAGLFHFSQYFFFSNPSIIAILLGILWAVVSWMLGTTHLAYIPTNLESRL